MDNSIQVEGSISQLIYVSLQHSFLWALLCFIMHTISVFLSPLLIPRISSLPKGTRNQWYNRNVSILHAITMSIFAVYYWIFLNPTRVFTLQNTQYQALTIDIMMGYLWYDIIYELSTTRSIDTLGHHFMGLISHYSTRFSNNGAAGYYSMLIYLAEISTPCLHTSWIMHQLNLSQSMTFQVIVIILIIQFFLFRYLLGPYMVIHMLFHREAWNETTDTSGILYWGNVGIVTFFAILNIFWFHKLVAMAFKKKTIPKITSDQLLREKDN